MDFSPCRLADHANAAPNIHASATSPVMISPNLERLPWTATGRPPAGRTISLVLAAALALAIALVAAVPLVGAL